MPGQGRLGDKASVDADAHGCPGCPHPGTGPAIQGSADVFVNSRPALRVDDVGVHMACCGPNMWKAQKGAPSVFINGKAGFRLNDASKHCGGVGKLIEGSSDVIVGDSTGGGSGGGGGSSSSGSSSSGSGPSSTSTAQSSTTAQSSAAQSSTASPSSPDGSDRSPQDAQATALTRAAEAGAPFVEECPCCGLPA